MAKLKDAYKQQQRGLTLIGILVATFVFVTILIATMTLMGRTTREVGRSRERLIAANLAREGLELVQSVRDTNFFTCPPGATAPNPACPAISAWTDVQTPPGLPPLCTGDAQRTITIEPDFGVPPALPPTAPLNIIIRDGLPPQSPLFLDGNGHYTHTATANPTIYSREIIIDCAERDDSAATPPVERIIVESRVTWRNRDEDHEVVLRTHLYNWYQ